MNYIFMYGLAAWEFGKGKSFLTVHETTDEIILKIWVAEDQTLLYKENKLHRTVSLEDQTEIVIMK